MDEIPELDELYRTPPEEFVAARDALVKQLRERGEKEQAATVKGMRRPSAAAWALNQLHHRVPDQVDEYFAVAADLGEAQGHGTGGSSDVRELLGRYRRAHLELVRSAIDVLRDAGRDADAQRLALESTVAVAASDSGVGELLRVGRLAREEVGGSFGLLPMGPAPSEPDDRSAKPRRARKAASGPAVADTDDAGAETRRAAVTAARQAVADAEEEADRLGAGDAQARERVAQVSARIEELRAQLAEAEAELERAQAELDEAAAALDTATGALDCARADLERLT